MWVSGGPVQAQVGLAQKVTHNSKPTFRLVSLFCTLDHVACPVAKKTEAKQLKTITHIVGEWWTLHSFLEPSRPLSHQDQGWGRGSNNQNGYLRCFFPWRGGSRVPHTYSEKWFFWKPFRIIPWLWKRVLHLVWALYYVYMYIYIVVEVVSSPSLLVSGFQQATRNRNTRSPNWYILGS